MIGIINYGAGNLRSVILAFHRCGIETIILNNPLHLNDVDAFVLPGVGSFYSASRALSSQGWNHAVLHQLSCGKKMLGICLGMQLLFEYGTEEGCSQGLGIIPGSVCPIQPQESFRVPHTGWNSVIWQSDHPVTQGLQCGIDFYHVHSYHCIPTDTSHILAFTSYGSDLVTAVGTDQVVGFQFHPEKSQPAGLVLLKNFIDWACVC